MEGNESRQSPVINKGLGRGSLGFGEENGTKEHENQNKSRWHGRKMRVVQSPVIDKGLGRGSLAFERGEWDKKEQKTRKPTQMQM
ncbi:hypothetical protein CEXT_433291 [Caerostris extrusa]|uniref:Uncharacterized protein n=1 Tax=Caerostris extrusa TaxID=172846 RepID=A0AAV4R1B6_CAEEX|nr:hypothetical protein CEXT_433291 [Caerostris extrusa]